MVRRGWLIRLRVKLTDLVQDESTKVHVVVTRLLPTTQVDTIILVLQIAILWENSTKV